MAKLSVGFFSLLLVGGCSKAPEKEIVDRNQKGKPAASVKSVPVEPKVFEAPDAQAGAEIREKVKALLAVADYEKIDQLARDYRKSIELDACGVPKVGEVYAALHLTQEAPEPDWQKQFAALRTWIKAKPESITARVALADLLVSYGWKARGSGYADTVTDQGARLMEERLNQAVLVLRDASKLQEKCPRYFSVLLQAALGLGFERPKYDAVFEAAIRSNPTYATYYRLKAVYLLPRWEGKPGESEQFLAKAADRIGGEEGDLLYAQVVWQLHSMQLFKNMFTDCTFSWERVQKGLEVIEKRFPDSLFARSEQAYLAAQAGQGKAAHNLLDKLEGKVDLRIWHTKENFDRVAQWASTQ